MVDKQDTAKHDRRDKPRSMSANALKARVDLFVRLGASLSVLVVAINVAAFVFEITSLQIPGRALLGMLIAFLSLGFLHIWHLTNKQLADLQVALSQLHKARSEADEANQAKSQFLATVSHELRTPMNGVMGMTGLLLDTRLTDEQRSYAEAVEVSSRSLLSIIDELLDAAKAESGEMTIVQAPFDLCELVESSVELLASRAHAKGIEIGCHVCPMLGGSVYGDKKRLQQVIMNIAGNAIKFTSSGSVCIHVSRLNRSGMVEFGISDTGHGIPEEELKSVFDRFVQSSLPQNQAAGGTGLGLSISRYLVDLMGGEIDVQSILGEGSSFRFSIDLPEIESQQTPSHKPARTATASTQPLSNCRVILLASEGATRTVLETYLNGWGAECETLDASQMDRLEESVNDSCKQTGRAVLMIDTAACSGIDEVARLMHAYCEKLEIWVILRPEDRRLYKWVMDDARVHYLLKPARRSTILAQLLEEATHMTRPVRSLRKTAEKLRRVDTEERLKVMLVEDNRINMLLATNILKADGHDVAHFASGSEAVSEIERNIADTGSVNHDIILMDIFMPGIDGLEAARKIRAMESRQGLRHRVPILAMTANSSQDDQHKCLDAGMDGYLAKPFDRNDLQLAILQLTGANRAA